MNSSIESRSPFLGHDVVEMIMSTRHIIKTNEGHKGLLKFFSKSILPKKNLNRVIDLSNIKKLIDELGLDGMIGDRASHISIGQSQRIGIARALHADRKIIIFDQVTNALDVQTEQIILKNIRNLKINKIIFIVIHKDENLNYCDKVFEVKNKDINLWEK